jgi:DNA (cytosine-5)-methyltransferase 1
MTIIDLFAGPGGWDVGLEMLGRSAYGIEWEKYAVQTRIMAGHATEKADIALLDPTNYLAGGPVEGLIASPPCQAFSLAGKRLGHDDKPLCYKAADELAEGGDPREDVLPLCGDPRSLLVVEPVRWVRDLRPTWIALEEVRAVEPLWEHYATIFRAWGYHVWTGVLNSADYGVPQTRERMILMAHREREIGPPPPTHSRDGGAGEDLFGDDRKPWVTMAQALGWGMTARPSVTVMARTHDPETGRTSGGVRPLDGGSGARATLASARETGEWESKPAWAHERPSTTIVGSFRPDKVAAPGWRKPGDPPRQDTPDSVTIDVTEAGVLQSFPADYPWQGPRTRQFEQVGNAVPPRLAAHVLARLLGIDPTEPIEKFYE